MQGVSVARRSSWEPKGLPDGFAETFIRFGWRGVETAFGARTSCNKRWVAEAGGRALIERRQWYRERLREVRRSDACSA